MLARTKKPKAKVLFIDDSRLIRIAATKMFGDEFDVVLAVDGADGLDVIKNDPSIQVVFTDLVMPEMDGFELLEAIRTCDVVGVSSLPVIVATGADNPEIAKQKAFNLGATDFITKPFNATDIKARALSYAQLSQTNKILREQTTLDVLTGAFTAKGFHRQLEKEMAFVSRHRASITVMAVEIDSFKDLFISIGRAGAEAVIRKVSGVLTDTIRKEDSVARTGVASFGLSMPLAQAESSLELAERICKTVESFGATLEGRPLQITVSVGVCVVEPGTSDDVEGVLDASEEALYRATKLGRSQLYHLSLDEFQREQDRLMKQNLSVDAVLEQLGDGQQNQVVSQLDDVLDKLAPLLSLLSNEQRQRIISLR
jgi:diguanylate cyclase (GGDEF)-like protein